MSGSAHAKEFSLKSTNPAKRYFGDKESTDFNILASAKPVKESPKSINKAMRRFDAREMGNYQKLAAAESKEESPESINAALQFFAAEEYEKALAEFSRIIRQEPDNLEARYLKGITYNRMEKYQEAVDTFKEILERDPKYKGARSNMGLAYFKLEKYDLALEVLEKAVEDDPDSPSGEFFLGLTYQQQEKYQESLIHLQKALTLDPGLAQSALFQIGLAYYKMGESEEAVIALEQSVDQDPESEIGQEAQNLMSSIEGGAGAKKDWRVKAKFGWQYDDNVSVTQEDTVTGETDTAAIFDFSAGYKLLSIDTFIVETGYDFYQSLYSDLAEFNFQNHSISLGGSHNGKTWDGGVDYFYNYSLLNENDFLVSHIVVPRVGFSATETTYTNVSFMVQDKNFMDDNNRDGVNLSAGMDQYVFLFEGKAFGFVSYRFFNENTIGTEFDYHSNQISGGMNFSGPFDTKAFASYTYTLDEYRQDTVSIAEQRRDEKQSIHFKLEKDFLSYMKFIIDYQRNISNSNLTDVDYKQHLLTLSLQFSM